MFINILKKIYRRIKKYILIIKQKIDNYNNKKEYQQRIREILAENTKPIIVFPPLLDWNIPLFQRPQHIAINLSNQGYLYFYCVVNHYDKVNGFEKLNYEGDLFLTDQYDLLMSELDEYILHVYAQDPNISNETISDNLNKGCKVLYEYIDELSEDLCTAKENVYDRHINVLKNEDIHVVATASKLLDEVKGYRKAKYKLVTNGVEYEHFQRIDSGDIPKEIEHIVNFNKPIIGYYGALAKWFDYELIKKLSIERPEYEILLVGWDYDGTLEKSGIINLSNVTVIGPIDYKILPQYARYFDVSTIPFLINDITESTSPVKLFEYMALGKPIVTTDLPECRKYESVLIGKNHEQFILEIDNALNIEDMVAYKSILHREAQENTWESKAKEIHDLIR